MTTHTIELEIANLSPKDVQFFRGIIALFTDPENGGHLLRLQAGTIALQFNPEDGVPNLLTLLPNPVSLDLQHN